MPAECRQQIRSRTRCNESENDMLIPERQNLLQELIASRGVADLETLASELRVSHSTVRRDIDALAQRGLVKRTHGGAIWIGERNGANGSSGFASLPYAFDQRM